MGINTAKGPFSVNVCFSLLLPMAVITEGLIPISHPEKGGVVGSEPGGVSSKDRRDGRMPFELLVQELFD